ncbi:MAG: AAA family ATPase, partial [bacterium]|nr:AAA family ATPase [bacterium]
MNDILYLFNPWWENKDFFTGVQRRKYTSTVKKFLTNKLAIIFVGSRRVGKTILLHQIIKDLLKENVSPKKIIYLPLDHPAMETKTPLELIETARAIHGLKRNEKLFVFWDEVQGRKDWEKQAKAVIDFENIKLFLSGSVGAL